eukprot:scaffold216108_cov37-Tisochrysis_lutea.AAC.1
MVGHGRDGQGFTHETPPWVPKIDAGESCPYNTLVTSSAAVASSCVVEDSSDHAVGTPAVGTPAADSPAADSPAVDSPAVDSPAADSPAAGTPAAGTPAAGTPAAGTPAAGTPAAGTPAADTSAADTPAGAAESDVVVFGQMTTCHQKDPGLQRRRLDHH